MGESHGLRQQSSTSSTQTRRRASYGGLITPGFRLICLKKKLTWTCVVSLAFFGWKCSIDLVCLRCYLVWLFGCSLVFYLVFWKCKKGCRGFPLVQCILFPLQWKLSMCFKKKNVETALKYFCISIQDTSIQIH